MSKSRFPLILMAAVIALLVFSAACQKTESGHKANYITNKAPLKPNAYIHLPYGSIRADGWLQDQLNIQKDGLTGYLWDGIWDGVPWPGGQINYEEGTTALALLLEDPKLMKFSREYIEKRLSEDYDITRFEVPRMAMRMLIEYYEATEDPRVIDWMENFFDKFKTAVKEGKTAKSFDYYNSEQYIGGKIFGDYLVLATWLFNRNGDEEMLEAVTTYVQPLMDTVTKYFLEFPLLRPLEKETVYDYERSKGMVPRFETREWYFTSHCVDIATDIRHPAFLYLQTGEEKYKKAVFNGIEKLDEYFGQAGAKFVGQEHFNVLEEGRKPTAAGELCTQAENMMSMEKLFEVFGEVSLADRLELLAYNSFPGMCTADMWAHQYDSQANQVNVSIADRGFDNRGSANIYGLCPHFNCCLFNLHQHWPRFVSNMWMATHKGGLVAVAYGPCEVKAKVADGVNIFIREETDYPFGGKMTFTIEEMDRSAKFPLELRIPSWAEGAEIKIGDEIIKTEAGTVAVVERKWKQGDVVELLFPMNIRTERRYNNSVSILRGPLYYVLRMGERFEETKFKWWNTEIRGDYPSYDWSIFPINPWNYGLIFDTENPGDSIQVKRNEISPVPWAQVGEPIYLKVAEGVDKWKEVIWDKPEPVVLVVKGQLIPEWTYDKTYPANAGDVPVSPVKMSDLPIVELELIPYGSSRLRITEFPHIKK